MGKVFQPKVIIGSVCGIIASIVGFIAIFFPSLFNLELEQLGEPVEYVAHNYKDMHILFEKLAKLDYEKQRIFKLDLLICHIDELSTNSDNWTKAFIHSDKNKTMIEIPALSHDTPGIDGMDASYTSDCTLELKGNIEFEYFPEHSCLDCTKNSKDENAGEKDALRISEYFMPIKSFSPHAEEETIILQNVPKEHLKLKNY